MQDDLKQSLEAVLDAVEILSSTSFTFAGEPATVIDPQTAMAPQAGGIAHPMPGNPLVREIQSRLYSRCYMERFDPEHPAASRADPLEYSAEASADFAARIAAANATREFWDTAWSVYQLGQSGVIQVMKGDRCRSARPGEYQVEGGAGAQPAVGSKVSLRVEKGSFASQPGFYHVHSEVLGDSFDDFATVRFYFHVGDDGAPELITFLTHELNRYRVPFRFKTASAPHLYRRSDAAVLYVAKRFFQITARVIDEGVPRLVPFLRPHVPLFSRRVCDGIGIAEDPGNGESFGMNRCRLVADGILDGWLQKSQDLEARIAAVRQRFAMNGLNLDAPHLNPGSADLYSLDGLSNLS